MKEFIEKLIGRLEESVSLPKMERMESRVGKKQTQGFGLGVRSSVGIVNQLAEEYNNGWIPCSERIPVCAGKYLVTTDGTFGIDVIDIALFESYEWHKSADIIAWQSLPNPYKKEVRYDRSIK